MRAVVNILIGALLGIGVTATFAKWGSSAQGYSVTCYPELPIKSNAACYVVRKGRIWDLAEGGYLNAEHSYRGWKQALGAQCGKKYDEYYLRMESVNKTFMESEGSLKTFEHPSTYFFACENRIAS